MRTDSRVTNITNPPESRLCAEIEEQPAAIARLLDAEASRMPALVRRLRAKPSFVMIAARGTSDNAARYAQYAFALQAGLPVALASPSIITLYNSRVQARGALFIAISQSGASPDILETLKSAKRSGARTLAIVNNTESALAAAADEVLPLHAGPEQSVAATKTYTTELTAVALLAAALGGRGDSAREIQQIPAAVARALATRDAMSNAASMLQKATRAVVLARGVHLCTCHELSLKLKELALLLAEPYSSADFQHGPIAMAEPGLPVIVLIPPGTPARAELVNLTKILTKKGCRVLTLGPRGGAAPISRSPEWLSPIPAIVPGQWLAFHAARVRGHNPDRPRGITKVTRTR